MDPDGSDDRLTLRQPMELKPVEVLPPRKTYRTRLQTSREVARELAKVYRKMKAGTLASEDGRAQAYVLRSLEAVLGGAHREERIAEIEQYLAEIVAENRKLKAAMSGGEK